MIDRILWDLIFFFFFDIYVKLQNTQVISNISKYKIRYPTNRQ